MTQAELEEEYKALEEAHVRWRPYSFLGSRSRIHLDTIRDLMKRLEDMTVRRDEWHATANLAAKDAADMRHENDTLRVELAEARDNRVGTLERAYAALTDLMPRGEDEWTGVALNGRTSLGELRAAIDAARRCV